MPLSWLPSACLALGALTLCCSVAALIFAFKSRKLVRCHEAEFVRAGQFADAQLNATKKQESLERRLDKLFENQQAHFNWVSECESLHLSRRAQVLRMHRRGEKPAEIASALRLPHGEVALTIKVYEISSNGRGEASRVNGEREVN